MIRGGAKKAYLFRRADRAGSWLAEGEEVMGGRCSPLIAEVPSCRRMAAISNCRLRSAVATIDALSCPERSFSRRVADARQHRRPRHGLSC